MRLKPKLTILRAISKARQGMTAGQVCLATKDLTPHLRVYLSTWVSKGFLRTDDKHECQYCGSRDTVYRITEKGRIWLANRDV